MSKEINRIHWKCRRGMREIDLLLREFSKHSLEKLSDDQLLLFEEILNYDDQSLYDFLFKQKMKIILMKKQKNKESLLVQLI